MDIQVSHFNKIEHLIKINRLGDAIKVTREYIQLYPHDSDGYAILGEIYLKEDKYNDAVACANEALKLDPSSYKGWQVAVSTYYEKQDWKNFDKVILQAQEIYPEEEFYFFLKGNRLNKENKHKMALECFEKAIQLEPYNAIYIACASYTLAILHENDKSIEYEKQALELEVESDLVFLYLGWAADKRGDFDKAIEFLGIAVKLDPSDQQIRREYLSILQNKYRIYRIFTFPSRLKRSHVLILWFVSWLFFKPLLILFLFLYLVSHWVTKLIVHIKVFGWTLRRA